MTKPLSKSGRKKAVTRLKARAMVQVALSDRVVQESRLVLNTLRIIRAKRP